MKGHGPICVSDKSLTFGWRVNLRAIRSGVLRPIRKLLLQSQFQEMVKSQTRKMKAKMG